MTHKATPVKIELVGENNTNPRLEPTEPTVESDSETPIGISKPSKFDLNKFKSKHSAAIANVETLQTGLPHHKLSEAKDFVRLHPNEHEYWSPELSFVNVPNKGQKRDTLHLIQEELTRRMRST